MSPSKSFDLCVTTFPLCNVCTNVSQSTFQMIFFVLCRENAKFGRYDSFIYVDFLFICCCKFNSNIFYSYFFWKHSHTKGKNEQKIHTNGLLFIVTLNGNEKTSKWAHFVLYCTTLKMALFSISITKIIICMFVRVWVWMTQKEIKHSCLERPK